MPAGPVPRCSISPPTDLSLLPGVAAPARRPSGLRDDGYPHRVWDTVLGGFVWVLFTVVLVIATLSLITLVALVLASWVGRRRGDGSRPEPEGDQDPPPGEDGPR